MSRDSILKYTQFLLIVLTFVAVDQITKWYASEWLATQRPGHFSHNIVLQVEEEDAGKTVEEYLGQTFGANSPEEVQAIAQQHTRRPDGRRLAPDMALEAGDEIEVTRREVVVIEGYWDYQYTRNPGAAFGILSNSDSSLRRPFFIVVSLLAVLIILGLLRSVPWRQQILVWGLSLIAAGAVGNFIDRIRFGYVIDFVVWKYTDEYRWPTFNVADALICIGVAFMIIEMIRDVFRARAESKAASEEEASATNS
ncbi:MAG: signal peptidase II [Bradymonadaceae bacterium]